MAIGSNLYPPIMATYMPAFLRYNNCVINFSLSSYNNFSEIGGAELSVRYQTTDRTALRSVDGGKTLGENYVLKYAKDEIYLNEDGSYHIILPVNNIQDGIFASNTIYKAQIRFISNTNEVLKSEWSTVCLLIGIDEPKLHLKNFEVDNTITERETIPQIQQSLDIIGYMDFNTTSSKIEKTYLSKWQAKIYINEDDNKTLVYDTGVILTNSFSDPNNIYHVVKKNLPLDKFYIMKITLITNNGYILNKVYNFKLISSTEPALKADFFVSENQAQGALDLKVIFNEKYSGNIVIRRSNSKDNFSSWEDFYTIGDIFTVGKDFVLKDNTVESGIWYKYQVQKKNDQGKRSIPLENDKPKMIILDDAFISDKDNLLCLKYNTNISNINFNTAEGKTNTIGSKYPYIRTNGSMDYKSFPISGTIAYSSNNILSNHNLYKDEETFEEKTKDNTIAKYFDADTNSRIFEDSLITETSDSIVEENMFYNRKETLGEDIYNLYQDYNLNNSILETKDFTLEKEFREEVLKFLRNNKPKLFRSASEGNIVVKLMNVSVTPNQQLGRLVYDFSAEAVEIDDNDFESLVSNNLLNIGSYKVIISESEEKIGQIFFEGTKEEQNYSADIVDMIRTKIEGYEVDSDEEEIDSYQMSLNKIKSLNITFNSNPYPIKDINGSLTKIYPIRISQNPDKYEYQEDSDLYGYILRLNGEDIFVGREGKYNINSEDVSINTIYVLDDNVTIDYVAAFSKIYKSFEARTAFFYKKIGQERKTFNYKEDILDYLKERNDISSDTFSQKLNKIFGLRIEGDEGLMIGLKTSDMDEMQNFILDDIESLNFTDINNKIEQCIIKGFILKESDNPILRTNEFYRDPLKTDIFKLKFLKEKYVYAESDDLKDNLMIEGQSYDDSKKQIYLGAVGENVKIITKDEELPTESDDNAYIFRNEGTNIVSLVPVKKGPFIIFNGNICEFVELEDRNEILVKSQAGIIVDYCCEIKGEEY